jgi:L-2-hydroxyglutarate oxidase
VEILDTVIVGGGAVGMSTAYHLASEDLNVAVIEKEHGPAMHQSGRNSGVIHAGYNQKPGTQKAGYCVEGNVLLKEYCFERGVPVTEGGILIVANSDAEASVLDELERRGTANGASVRMLAEDEIKLVEPHARGIQGLQALDGASIDAAAYVSALASDASRNGVKLFYDRQVASIQEHDDRVVVETSKGSILARTVINAAGLYADTLAGELSRDMRVIPFRGYYAELKPERADAIKSHVYSAPDLDFPFLGVHLSKRTDGRVIVGPGAMLALGREAYSLGSLEGGGLNETLSWPGFYRMMCRPEVRSLIRQEIKKSLSLKAIASEAMAIVPNLSEDDFVKSYAGNRAQLVDRKGNLVDDIVVRQTPRTIHILNVVTPGLTCSLPFGRDIATQALDLLNA